jgi:peptidoglycan/xylan/chitin deacetylase (PgdA/CDA1 family)
MRALVKRSFYHVQRRAARTRVRLSRADQSASAKFAIFVLHSVSRADSDMAVSPARLREQLAALTDAGYRCVDFGDVLTAVSTGRPFAHPSFALTFDDGYRNVFEQGLPILEAFNATATLFVTVNLVEKKVAPPWYSSDPALLKEYRDHADQFQPLDWQQLRELQRSNRVRIGSHSMNHPLMGRLSDSQLRRELRDSKTILEDRLGAPVAWFAYPFGVKTYGAYSDGTETALREIGYTASCTSEIGRARIGSGPFLLPRMSLVEHDTGADACAKAAGAYDWVGVAQRSFQRFFSNPHEGQQ